MSNIDHNQYRFNYLFWCDWKESQIKKNKKKIFPFFICQIGVRMTANCVKINKNFNKFLANKKIFISLNWAIVVNL